MSNTNNLVATYFFKRVIILGAAYNWDKDILWNSSEGIWPRIKIFRAHRKTLKLLSSKTLLILYII